jgi:hypothetical protein
MLTVPADRSLANRTEEERMSRMLLPLAAAAIAVFATSAIAQSVSLNAVLNGANECDNTPPPAGPICAKGDSDGYGIATITFPSSSSLCASILVNKIAPPSAAHIHTGKAGVNGGVLVTLPTPAPVAGTTAAVSANCVTGLAAGVVPGLRNNPAGFYVNVHNGPFPGGAVRGQLF